jgi:hypothetical protein
MKTGIAYFGVRNPEFVKVDLQIIRSLGYTHILHTFSEEDLKYYPDTMREIISLSKKMGLGVYVNPWGVGRVFGGESFSEIAARKPHAAQISNFDTSLVAACPNAPEFMEYMNEWIDFVCSTEVDTIFWDEPHFYFEKGNDDLWACTCESCQKGFRRSTGHSMPNTLTKSVKEFRQSSLVKFLDKVTSRVHQHGKLNSVCLLPHYFNDGIEDWDRFALLPHVDEIGTDPYWEKGTRITEISKTYHKYSAIIHELGKKYNKQTQMWIKNYHIVKNNEESVNAATWAAFNEGIRNIFAWSYKGSEYLSWLRSDDPEKVWEIQTNAFLECHERAAEEELIVK